MKMVCDGSISERTARLSVPYEGRPNDNGILVMTEEELYAHGHKAHLAGWQIGTHANGDVGIDTTLRVYERLQRESPRRDPRFRLEHCTVVNDGLIARIKALEPLVDAKRSEEHTSELQSRLHLVCRLLLEKKNKHNYI